MKFTTCKIFHDDKESPEYGSSLTMIVDEENNASATIMISLIRSGPFASFKGGLANYGVLKKNWFKGIAKKFVKGPETRVLCKTGMTFNESIDAALTEAKTLLPHEEYRANRLEVIKEVAARFNWMYQYIKQDKKRRRRRKK